MCVFLQQFGCERFLQLESHYRTFRSLESWDIGSRVPRGVYAHRKIILEKNVSSLVTSWEALAAVSKSRAWKPAQHQTKTYLTFLISALLKALVSVLQ